MRKKALGLVIKLGVTVGLFTLLFRPETFGLPPDFFGGVTPAKMLEELKGAEIRSLVPWLLFAAVVKLAGMFAGVLRWRLLLHGQGLQIPFWYMVQSWFVGRFIGIFLPSTIGLDGYRLYDSSRYTGEVIKSTTVIAVEKLIGFVALTGLLFLTFPFGFRLLNINVVVFALIVLGLGIFVAVSFLLLLNPRVIQVLVAILPTPASVQRKINKLGASVTAYSGSRPLLIKAAFLGLLVHLGTCFMYFGTMMSIRAQNTSLTDILFASPVMIYGTVLGPSIGGEGIREIVFVKLLSGTSGAAAAALFAHLGWWIGEVVPFLIGAPIFLRRTRPAKEELESELAAARRQASEADDSPHLSFQATLEYRNSLVNCAVAGIAAGLIGGALIGLVEAGWIARTLSGLEEFHAFWWGPLVYGFSFLAVGVGVAVALAFLYLLIDRFAPHAVTFALSFGATLAAGALVIGWFRYKRDILADHAPTMTQNAMILASALAVGVAAAVLVGLALARVRASRNKACGAAAVAFVGLVIVGGVISAVARPASRAMAFAPKVKANGPNIILIAADALRADYLPLYAPDTAVAKTPNLDAFAEDAVFFQNCFSQAAWTKPSFATIFSGIYPGSHTATSKTAILPDGVTTVAEILRDGGYYTKGFANNPHISPTFGFHQGFVHYVDLKPSLYFGATPSAAKLSLYEVLRRVRQKVAETLFKGRMIVTEFYQPAEVVTEHALAWLDTGEMPDDVPFFLFLHYMDPHDPFMDWEQPGVGYARVRMKNPDPNKFRQPMKKAYNLDIEHMDEHLGGLFAGLRERGLYDNALIVFTADHGEEFYDHEGWWHGFTLYDELIHIPLMIKLPKNSLAGKINPLLARHIDIAPTLLHQAGLTPADAMRGQSLFTDDGDPGNGDTNFIYAENDFEGNVLQAVRTQTSKIIRANEDNVSNLDPVEFYDLEADPCETTNLAGQGLSFEEELNGVLEEMVVAIREDAAAPVLVEEISEELRDQLEDLGYLD